MRHRISVLRIVLRACLWLGLLVVLARGALTLVVTPTVHMPATRVVSAQRDPLVISADQAIAFAAGFARTYLTDTAATRAGRDRALARYLAPGLDPNAGLTFAGGARSLAVLQATFAGLRRIGFGEALITFAVDLISTTEERRYLTVPVSADSSGAFSVFDYPSFASPPGLAAVTPATPAPLAPADDAEIHPLLARFFPAYLGANDAELSYFAPATVHLKAIGGPFVNVQLIAVGGAAPQGGRRLDVVASVRADDRALGASYLLSYRVTLERDARWYVTAVNGSAGSVH